ncbi:hypothetical protein A1O3_00655 [Capronia epimyces CBS 606.96]|uniref:Major facilitator superfamily (MFS) profile domain-containing protein n=1 Tax=Capronia epimyces CBS 606.96 TaxID=1182542 RepID=W9YR07_9EURO|nr:uncharacterized protein A1O3_00655 [Capronia epimyces CBS 606.96]EXJ92105.1 hypothetical protein A1O3_00655 [Capronia epimyces CBS 606.96]
MSLSSGGTQHTVEGRGDEEKPQADANAQAGQETSSTSLGAAPDGGLRAWLVTTGAAFITFAALGYANSFGVFQEYYMAHQLANKSADQIAWIGSLSSFIQFGAGTIGGPLFDRFGAWIVRPAVVLYVFGIMMTSLCHEYWQFMLAQGVLLGLATGLLMVPSIVAVSQYFDKKRAAALGLAISGSSIGGVVLPIAFSKMLNSSSLGFGWTVRIMGFVMMPLLAFSCLTIKSRLPPTTSTFFIPAAFRKANFSLLVVAMFFLFLGMFTPLFFIPTYAVTRGMHATLASYLLAIINAASTFGRVVPGVLADKFGRLNILGLGAISTGVVILCMNKAESTAALVVYSIVFGFTSGTIISGVSAAFSVCPEDPREIGTYVGMGMGASSVAVLIGPPINGALVHRYGGFSQLSIFSGVMCLTGGLVAFASKATTPEGILARR